MGVYLTKPNKKKQTIVGKSKKFNFVISSMQGWRNEMEDAHICESNLQQDISLFGVLDGHGGKEVACFVQKNFLQTLQKNENFINRKYQQALLDTFFQMDDIMRLPDELKQFQQDNQINSNAGCTANILLMTKDEIYVANCGDSRAILFQKNKVVQLSQDHKPNLPEEYKRIINAGGKIKDGRINKDLNLSRSLGDFNYKINKNLKPEFQIISPKPDIQVIQIQNDFEFIIMGCDGIWEQMTNMEICLFVKERLKKGADLKQIAEQFLEKNLAPNTENEIGCDNMTIILILFN